MLYINITTDQGELLERFAVLVDETDDPHGAVVEYRARAIREHIERSFDVPTE
jgi:hypothetical protein